MPPVQGQNLADALGADKATYMLLEGVGQGGEQFATPENLQLVYALPFPGRSLVGARDAGSD